MDKYYIIHAFLIDATLGIMDFQHCSVINKNNKIGNMNRK